MRQVSDILLEESVFPSRGLSLGICCTVGQLTRLQIVKCWSDRVENKDLTGGFKVVQFVRCPVRAGPFL
jgi:hypothetical protein